jgi:hypothetical protein
MVRRFEDGRFEIQAMSLASSITQLSKFNPKKRVPSTILLPRHCEAGSWWG